MPRLLGIDIGTTGCKALLIDERGHILAQAHAEYPISTPHPGWSEQDPEDWWKGVHSCIRQIGERPDAIGLSGQMHGSVFLDSSDSVIRPALLWNDQRTAAECKEIDDRVGFDRVRQLTANPPLTGFQLPKLLWLRNREPENYRRVRSVLLPKDYIRFRLTGEKTGEPSDCSGTGFFHVGERRWASEMGVPLDVDPSLFPPVLESWVVGGKTHEGVPVVGGGGDQAAGAVGTGAVVSDVISVSLGTSGVVFVARDEAIPDPTGATHTFCHANGKWHRMGVMLSCGGALRWFRDTFAPGMTYDELAAEAETVPPGSDGVTFLPYLTGERCPHNDPNLRASFTGLSLAHGRAHLTRAVFEGVSFGVMDCLRAVLPVVPPGAVLRLTGGGAKGKFWSQMISDVTGLQCVTLAADEGPAYGAALLAGVGIGVWGTVEEACSEMVRPAGHIEPSGTDYSDAYARFGSAL